MVRWLIHAMARRQLVLHFQHQLSPAKERRMRQHLAGCAECRVLYNTLCLAEGQGELAAAARHQRLEAALFGSSPSPAEATSSPASTVSGESAPWSRCSRWLVPAGAMAVLTLVLLLVVPRDEPAFREKGPAAATEEHRFVSVTLFHRVGDKLYPLRGPIRRDEALAFAYSNGSGQRFDRLLLFGLDEHYTVYWFYPAWTDARTNPAAYPIQVKGHNVELPEEVSHRYEGATLRIFALFSRRRDLTVRTVEQIAQQLAQRKTKIDHLRRFPLSGTGQHTILFEVIP